MNIVNGNRERKSAGLTALLLVLGVGQGKADGFVLVEGVIARCVENAQVVEVGNVEGLDSCNCCGVVCERRQLIALRRLAAI